MSTPTNPASGTIITLLQCSKQRCGHVLLESEQEKVPHPDFTNAKLHVCPKCHGDSFYTLNAQGQARRMSDTWPRGIIAEDINPSPRMGLKMRRRLFAAKNRALGIPSKSSL